MDLIKENDLIDLKQLNGKNSKKQYVLQTSKPKHEYNN